MSRTATEISQRLRSGAVIAVAIGIMNLSTYGYTVLAAHLIGPEAYGAFSALMGALLVISVLSLGLQATGARRISAEPHQVIAIERVVLGVGLRSALVLGAVCLALAPLLNAVLHLHSLPTAMLVGIAAFPLTYMGAQAGVLQGERRWALLAMVYLAQGLGRLLFGLALIIFWPTEFAAMTGVALGCWLPVLIGALALSRPRTDVPHSEGHPGLDLIREVGHSSQALLAFFALSNADILVARATMSNSQAGLYAAGLIMAKAILFLPQFALLFVGGKDFEPVKDDLYLFAIVGTLLSMVQLLVYSALARRQGRAVIMIWTALVVLVVSALAVNTQSALVLVVVAIDGALFLALLGVALSTSRPAAAAATSAVRSA